MRRVATGQVSRYFATTSPFQASPLPGLPEGIAKPSWLLALVPGARFIGSLTAVHASERSTGASVCIIGFLGIRPTAAPAARSAAESLLIDRSRMPHADPLVNGRRLPNAANSCLLRGNQEAYRDLCLSCCLKHALVPFACFWSSLVDIGHFHSITRLRAGSVAPAPPRRSL